MNNIINYKEMKKWFGMPINKLESYIDKIDDTENLFYKDNGSKVLAVAHLDSVQKPEHFFLSKERIFSPVLDDRLGVYIIMYVLPLLDINVDVLLTDGEETGSSTAQLFESNKKYNWMVQFDRAGEDVVMYDYATAKYRKMLLKYFNKIGMGSFSDISYLEHLKVFGFNIGIGYKDYHNINAYADIKVLTRNVNRFKKFYLKYKDMHLPHDSTTKPYEYYHKYSDAYGDEYKGLYDCDGYMHDVCWICGEPLILASEKDAGYCANCFYANFGYPVSRYYE